MTHLFGSDIFNVVLQLPHVIGIIIHNWFMQFCVVVTELL